jgi:GH25 family lysozyme M1 (1,4-beta-N-acetylmuramidase)
MTNAMGEDRSSFQPVTSWMGDSFGIAKATEGTGWTDSTFAGNWANLRSAGMPRGAYHFFRPADSPADQAAFFWGTVLEQGIAAGDFLVADVEITIGRSGQEDYGTSRAAARAHTGLRAAASPDLAQVSLGALALEFLQKLSLLAGPDHRVTLYTDLYMAQNLLGACVAYPLHVAYFEPGAPNNVTPWMNWTFWQNGALGPGGGDLDYFAGDSTALRQWAHPGKTPLPPNWVYPKVRRLVAKGGDTSAALEWHAPQQPPGQQPMPAIREYEIAMVEGPVFAGPEIQSYPRFIPKGVNPETWQGGSLKRKTQYTAAVRAMAAPPGPGAHAGTWETVTFSTT